MSEQQQQPEVQQVTAPVSQTPTAKPLQGGLTGSTTSVLAAAAQEYQALSNGFSQRSRPSKSKFVNSANQSGAIQRRSSQNSGFETVRAQKQNYQRTTSTPRTFNKITFAASAGATTSAFSETAPV